MRQKLPLMYTLLSVGILIFLFACSANEPIKIGFVGGLTGRHSDLGIAGRNGVLMAIEEVNNQGGVNGRSLELLIKDDKQDSAVARKVDQELIDDGVVAIIGHFTSSMSVAALDVPDSQGVLLFSPTTSTSQLAGIDDNFLRVFSPNKVAIDSLASHAFDEMGLKNIFVIYDLNNKAFSYEWFSRFKDMGVNYAAKVDGVGFSSNTGIAYNEIATQALSGAPDAVLVVAAALDSAMICQQLKKQQEDIQIFGTMWSMSQDFLEHAGGASEGAIFINWFDSDHPGERSQEFQKQYLTRFGQKPSFASQFAYEAASILIDALRVSPDSNKLKQIIVEKEHFEGIQGPIRIDQYGDAVRDFFLMTVDHGKYKRMVK